MNQSDLEKDLELQWIDWLEQNPNTTKEQYIEILIEHYEQEDDLNEYEKNMLDYLYDLFE